MFDQSKRARPAPEAQPHVIRTSAQRLQAKLRIGRADDPLEREADRIAADVIAPDSGGRPAAWPAPGTTRIRRSTTTPTVGANGGPVDAATESRIRAATGRPLDASTRTRMEAGFGHDLGDVRVHTGTDAAVLNEQLSARAFTFGSDIFFGSGQYRTDTADGDRLLAHEIAHTVQQSGGAHRALRRGYVPDADIEQPVAGVFTQDTHVLQLDGKRSGLEATKGQRATFTGAGRTILWLTINGTKYYVPKYAVALDQHVATRRALFDGDPAPGDVKQGSLGDCYLLAALASIAATRPQFIRGMMKDLDDKVEVRFYHVTQPGGEDQPFKYDPVWITVDKSSVKTSTGEDLYAKESLWVQMIEKAYVASRIDPNSLLTNQLPSASYDVFKDGGTGSFAMMMLLGADAVNPDIFSGYDRADKDVLPWGSEERTAWKGKNYAGMASFAIFGGDQALIDKWMTFVTTVDAQNEGPIERLFNGRTEFKDAAKQDPYYDGEIRVEHFEQMFKDEKLDSVAAKAMLAWFARERYYPTKRGRTREDQLKEPAYSTEQLKTYQLIAESLRDGKAVQLKTKDVPMRRSKQDVTAGNAGEAKGKGILGGHYYTALACEIDTTVVPGLGLRWVQVRNPWGKYGIEYQNRKLERSKVEEGNGVFWLELNDVTKYFKSVHFGNIPKT